MSKTMTDLIEINGETFEANVVPCPSCGADIDAQRALLTGECPACRTDARTLLDDDSDDTTPPEEYEAESYKVSA